MDSKLIQQYGEDILCYRLRTERQKKRVQYEDFDKHLIHLYKEELEIYQKIRNLGWDALTPPIQRGWKRTFVLRDDVARSKHAAFFEGILKKINTVDWSYRKDFKIKKRMHGRKKYVVKEQKLQSPVSHHFLKLDFNDAEKQFFYESWQLEWKALVKRYVFRKPWQFVLRVKPNMIDKVKKIDAGLESQLCFIKNYLERNDYEKKQMRLMHGRYQFRYGEYEKHSEVNLYKNKTLNQILDMIKENDE